MILEFTHPAQQSKLIISNSNKWFHSSYQLAQHRSIGNEEVSEDSIQRLAVKAAVNELEYFCKQLNEWLEENDNVE